MKTKHDLVAGYNAQAAVTDEALKKLYDEKYAKAEPSKEFDAAHILVETEEEAKANCRLAAAAPDLATDGAALLKALEDDLYAAWEAGDRLADFVTQGFHGDMGWMAETLERHPESLLRGKPEDAK